MLPDFSRFPSSDDYLNAFFTDLRHGRDIVVDNWLRICARVFCLQKSKKQKKEEKKEGRN
jgi:hypothetical protein